MPSPQGQSTPDALSGAQRDVDAAQQAFDRALEELKAAADPGHVPSLDVVQRQVSQARAALATARDHLADVTTAQAHAEVGDQTGTTVHDQQMITDNSANPGLDDDPALPHLLGVDVVDQPMTADDSPLENDPSLPRIPGAPPSPPKSLPSGESDMSGEHEGDAVHGGSLFAPPPDQGPDVAPPGIPPHTDLSDIFDHGKKDVLDDLFTGHVPPEGSSGSGGNGSGGDTGDPNLDTGHYDDGHSLEWKPQTLTDPAGTATGEHSGPDLGDTGHYDDGHSLGRETQPDPEGPIRQVDLKLGAMYVDDEEVAWLLRLLRRRPFALVLGSVLVVAAAIAVYALTRGSSSANNASVTLPANTVAVSGAVSGRFTAPSDCHIVNGPNGQVINSEYRGVIDGKQELMQASIFPYNGPSSYQLQPFGSARTYVTFVDGIGGSTPATVYHQSAGSIDVTTAASGVTANVTATLTSPNGTVQLTASKLDCH